MHASGHCSAAGAKLQVVDLEDEDWWVWVWMRMFFVVADVCCVYV